MRVMVIAKATEASEKGDPPTPEAFEAMDEFNEELFKAGIMVAGAGLKPGFQGKRVMNSKRPVTESAGSSVSPDRRTP